MLMYENNKYLHTINVMNVLTCKCEYDKYVRKCDDTVIWQIWKYLLKSDKYDKSVWKW